MKNVTPKSNGQPGGDFSPSICSAPPVDSIEMMIQWSPRLVDRLKQILERHLRGPEPVDNTSTPEMLMLAMRRRKQHENETLRQIRVALAGNPAESIDLDVIEAGERFMWACEDSQNVRDDLPLTTNQKKL